MDVKSELQKAGIGPDPLKDQFFLVDENIISKIAELADLTGNDVVLEIGAGVGNLTKELAKKAGRVLAFEIDERFKPFLDTLTQKVEVHIEDAHEYASQGGKFRKKKVYNKIVCNIPYSIGEWLFHNLPFVEYDRAILLVSKKFAESSKTNPVFSSFYKVEEKLEVPKEKFYPVPRTDSVVIDLVRLPNPIVTKDLASFLRQFIYQKEKWKAKNSIREGLITYARRVFERKLTKNQSRKIIAQSDISKDLLERPPDNAEIYQKVSEKISR